MAKVIVCFPLIDTKKFEKVLTDHSCFFYSEKERDKVIKMNSDSSYDESYIFINGDFFMREYLHNNHVNYYTITPNLCDKFEYMELCKNKKDSNDLIPFWDKNYYYQVCEELCDDSALGTYCIASKSNPSELISKVIDHIEGRIKIPTYIRDRRYNV